MRILGAILAGGASRRFGSDKALALAFGKPLMGHAIDSLHAVVGHTVICGREWPSMTSLADRPVSGLGPLGGLNAALHHARETGFDWVLSIACDTPFVAPDVLRSLIEYAAPGYIAAHPVIGLWPTDRADLLEEMLGDATDCSMRGWARRIAAQPLRGDVEIANLNYPEDLSALIAGGR
ncbi:MAG: molybdenum cofactor guanylyltransferase [Pseudomonadota bacterium]|uniref:molybdenum cofactor guanylyltransferase n=1 Tax=Sphingomonas sp. ERG5 TaxID=1381597 RepID=UPI00054BF9C9|nr:molybdenum cofactor guanylyltransferase [Sphingomonas sp. ERG5]